MRAALGVLAIAVATGAGLLVVSTPSSDAPVPAWMSSRVEAGRASILEHIDLVEPGSPLVLAAYHCRDDGAVRLVYRSRYLWLSERRYFADAPAGWSSGPMGGGTLSSGEDPRAQDDWLAERQEVDCSVPPATEFAHRCQGRTYSIGYPEGWFVHPGDPAADVAPCSYFAARPFDATREDDFGVAGAQVALWAGIGCRGSFDRVLSTAPMTIDHRPALRHELERGEGDPEPRAVEIAVQLRNPVPCENSSWIVGRTESDDPGSFEENAAILEAMMRSLDLDRWR